MPNHNKQETQNRQPQQKSKELKTTTLLMTNSQEITKSTTHSKSNYKPHHTLQSWPIENTNPTQQTAQHQPTNKRTKSRAIRAIQQTKPQTKPKANNNHATNSATTNSTKSKHKPKFKRNHIQQLQTINRKIPTHKRLNT